MSRLKYDQEILEFMSVFSTLTAVRVKDCFKEDGVFYCIIAEGDIGKAIGKQGKIIQAMKRRLNVRLRVIEYSPDVIQFIRNVIRPITVENIEQNDDIFIITPTDVRSRGILIGRNGKHIKLTNRIVKRFFPVKEVKVL
jgi:N utilization substance protein A